MQTLISCVGFSDPIRNKFYGPIMHLINHLKPDKIVLFFSEETLQQKNSLVKEIDSFSEQYHPEIICDSEIIDNDDTFVFDKMFEILYGLVGKYFSEDEEYIFNLSSGTPAMETALFSINRILGLNVKAYQVATPLMGSNELLGFDHVDDFKDKIKTIKENDIKSRLISDTGEKFEEMLLKESIKHFIQEYDYVSAYEIISTSSRFNINEDLLNSLKMIIDAVRYQQILPQVSVQDYDEDSAKLLNAFLIFILQVKRQMTSEVIIRGKNITEFICELYLNRKYAGIIKYDRNNVPNLDAEKFPGVKKQLEGNNGKVPFLSLTSYQRILQILGDKRINGILKDLQSYFEPRNSIAHNFKQINTAVINKITKTDRNGSYNIINQMLDLMNCVFKVDSSWLDFFESENERIISRLG